MMSKPTYNVLFLCTHNATRSIFAECLTNWLGRGKFCGFSAGSFPSGAVHPLTISTLQHFGCDTNGLRSKGWDEFAVADAPHMDFIITVCDDAAGETCPVWPGHPMTAHWGFPDPSLVEGDEETRRGAFAHSAHIIASRLRLFMCLPMDKLDHLAMQTELKAIGSRPA